MSDMRRWTEDPSKSDYASMLRNARKESLSKDTTERVLGNITAPLEAVAVPSPRRRGLATKMALGVGVCVLVAVGVAMVRSETPRQKPTDRAMPDARLAKAASEARESAPVTASAAAVAVDDLPSVASAPAITSARRPISAASRATNGEEKGSSDDDLAAETALLRAIRGDLRANRPGPALAKLDEYDARFAHGFMRQEAGVERVEALLQSGARERGRVLGKQMLEASPQGPFARRLRSLVGDDQNRSTLPEAPRP
jgi:hypothetical protein